MSIDNLIKKFIYKIQSSNVAVEDDEIIVFLTEKQYSKETITYVVLFVPIVTGRIICKSLNISFNNVYYEHLEDNTERKGFLNENIFYIDILEIMSSLIEKGYLNQETILKIAIRSPEFKIINDFTNQGSSGEDIKFSSLYINL